MKSQLPRIPFFGTWRLPPELQTLAPCSWTPEESQAKNCEDQRKSKRTKCRLYNRHRLLFATGVFYFCEVPSEATGNATCCGFRMLNFDGRLTRASIRPAAIRESIRPVHGLLPPKLAKCELAAKRIRYVVWSEPHPLARCGSGLQHIQRKRLYRSSENHSRAATRAFPRWAESVHSLQRHDIHIRCRTAVQSSKIQVGDLVRPTGPRCAS
jgi:hypothetical protein